MGVMHFISILLGCLITEVYGAAALPTARATVPPEAWHQYYYWGPQYYHNLGQAEERPVENPMPFILQPPLGHDGASDQIKVNLWQPKYMANAIKPTPETKKTTGKPKPQANNPQVKPRGFQLSLNVPVSNIEDKSKEHSKAYLLNRGEVDHSQMYYRPSQFQVGSHFDSKVSSHQANKDPQAASASKQGFHFSLSVPIASTTAAPKPFDGGNMFRNPGLPNTEFSQSRFFHRPQEVHEVHKPVYQKPSDTNPVPKPAESKLVTFLSGFLEKPRGLSDQGNQVNVHREGTHGFVKPMLAQQPSGPSGFHPGHHPPSNYWMGQAQLSSSSGVQRPVHQAVQRPVHFSPQWYQVAPPANLENRDGYDDIMQSIQNINGQLMIPLEKCPGFEGFAAHRHHGRVQHSHHVHHGRPPTSSHMPAKPQYTNFVLNMEGTAPNLNEASYENVQQSGAGGYPYTWWRRTGAADPQSHSSRLGETSVQFGNPVSYPSHVQRKPLPQHSDFEPGHSNYVVQLGANVAYEKPNTQTGHVQYLVPQRPHHY